MFVEALPERVRHNLARLGAAGIVTPFYLAGGTAAAWHLGHRISVDLDFFGPASFDPTDLAGQLSELGLFRLERLAPDTLLGEWEGVRISVFRYRYPLIAAPSRVLGIAIAGLEDLAAMKLDAVSMRGTRRDFVDLYFIAEAGLSLADALQCYQRKYAGLNVNVVHVVKSLAYFADAEIEPLPRMLKDVSWETVKRFFEGEVRRLMETL